MALVHFNFFSLLVLTLPFLRLWTGIYACPSHLDGLWIRHLPVQCPPDSWQQKCYVLPFQFLVEFMLDGGSWFNSHLGLSLLLVGCLVLGSPGGAEDGSLRACLSRLVSVLRAMIFFSSWEGAFQVPFTRRVLYFLSAKDMRVIGDNSVLSLYSSCFCLMYFTNVLSEVLHNPWIG